MNVSKFMKVMNGLVMAIEEDKRFWCVWLFYYVCNFADSRMKVPRSGLLIFRAVAEPRISSKSAKAREIHKNTRNPAKFAKNLTKYMSAQHI